METRTSTATIFFFGSEALAKPENALLEEGDANGDKNVDATDLEIWQSQFNNSNPLIASTLDNFKPFLAAADTTDTVNVNVSTYDSYFLQYPYTNTQVDNIRENYLTNELYLAEEIKIPLQGLNMVVTEFPNSAQDEIVAIDEVYSALESEHLIQEKEWEEMFEKYFDQYLFATI